MVEQVPQTALETSSPAAVAIRGLGKWIDERPILQEINLSIPAGQYVALLGANGAGKSTLLKILATLLPPTRGEIELFGEALNRSSTRVRARIGLIGHQAMLYRDLSARENLEFFGRLYGVKNPEARAMELLDAVGLAKRAEDPVKAFSRGMTQRMAISRALMHEPQLILADEPFAGLDAPSIRTVEQILHGLHLAKKTIVLVNHDIEQSLKLAERVIVMRGGRIIADQTSAESNAEQILAEVSV
ncbi:MAG TPA: ABC transporter ATP-binding protein [Tepidisphaeraceae bacterium]